MLPTTGGIPDLVEMFNCCLANGRIPDDWKKATIKLIPKANKESVDLSEWRPISLLLTVYKLFAKILSRRTIPWVMDNNRITTKQKGALPRNGLHEHVFCLTSAISDFRHRTGKMYITFIDLADAFGSIDHEFMIYALKLYGYPETFVRLTEDLYDNSYFRVETGSGYTDNIVRRRGIIQGCPLSVIVFEQAIDIWLRCLTDFNNVIATPNPIQGYVDDIVLCSTRETLLTEMCDKTDKFVNSTGMSVKHRKCATLHGQRSGNNWSTIDFTSDVEVRIQNKQLPKLGKNGKYTYLGHDISLDGKASESQRGSLCTEFGKSLKRFMAVCYLMWQKSKL